MMVIAVIVILDYHTLLFDLAASLRLINEMYLHSLLLLTLPSLIGSFQNLKHYQRWASYYFICKIQCYVFATVVFVLLCFFMYPGRFAGVCSVIYLSIFIRYFSLLQKSILPMIFTGLQV
jgi:hypothetical protein